LALGADLFGDHVNFYTGSLEFTQTDVSLPGNDALPVAVGRHATTGSFDANGRLFGGWDLEIAHLHGIFSSQGWVTGSTGALPRQRCSRFAKPPTVSGSAGTGGLWDGTEYWHGSFLYVPGTGDQELLRRSAGNPHVPADGAGEPYPYTTYPIVTRNLWAIKCLPSLANDSSTNKGLGEGFLAIAPDGTQYRFDWMVTRAAENLAKGTPAPQRGVAASVTGGAGADADVRAPSAPAPTANADGYVLTRKEVWILPTLLTDRYGNTVTYIYDAARPWQLKSIEAVTAAASR
jgi:hypothetical protein